MAMMRLLLALTSFALPCASAFAADLAVLVDGPARPAIVSVADEFKRSTGHSLTFVFAPGPVLNKRIMDGERADVVITPMRYVEELQSAAKAKVVDARSVGGAIGRRLRVVQDQVGPPYRPTSIIKRWHLEKRIVFLERVACAQIIRNYIRLKLETFFGEDDANFACER
jgi:hypothetical protein